MCHQHRCYYFIDLCIRTDSMDLCRWFYWWFFHLFVGSSFPSTFLIARFCSFYGQGLSSFSNHETMVEHCLASHCRIVGAAGEIHGNRTFQRCSMQVKSLKVSFQKVQIEIWWWILGKCLFKCINVILFFLHSCHLHCTDVMFLSHDMNRRTVGYVIT